MPLLSESHSNCAGLQVSPTPGSWTVVAFCQSFSHRPIIHRRHNVQRLYSLQAWVLCFFVFRWMQVIREERLSVQAIQRGRLRKSIHIETHHLEAPPLISLRFCHPRRTTCWSLISELAQSWDWALSFLENCTSAGAHNWHCIFASR
jgi:hypothetical protein